MAYYRCTMSGGSGDFPVTLTVTCDSAFVGETLYLTKGLTVLSKTVPATGIVEFEFPESGTWVLSNSLTSDTETFENVGEYEVDLHAIPDGKTVLPVNDIQIWLACAGIYDKDYTTLAEVLADEATLRTLMASENAVDYMVRSTQWATSVSVPNMISDTTPSGTVISGQAMKSTNLGYFLFDGLTNNQPYKETATNTGWIGYDFGSPVKIDHWAIYSGSSSRYGILGYSDDGINWTDYDTPLQTIANDWATQNVNVAEPHRYWRCTANIESPTQGFGINEAQFYSASLPDSELAMSYIGANDYAADTLLANTTWNEAIQNSEYFEKVDNAKVPVMTSNTTPSGKAFGDSIDSSYPAYKAMDGSDTNYALSLQNATNPTFGYTFAINCPIYLARLLVSSSANSSVTYTCKIQGSNDEFASDVHDISEEFTYSASINDKVLVSKICTLLSDSSSYRVINTARTSSAARFMAYTIQFYGRRPGGVQTWLNKAGITDKTYTNLAEVLADPVTLAALMRSEDAVDYLVTCKDWIDTITSNQDAMSYIGLSNYASDTLIADEDWLNAIGHSTYFESVLNAKNPIMTSNTEPSGECFRDSLQTVYQAYRSFDGIFTADGNIVWGPNYGSGRYVGYDFGRSIKIFLCKIDVYGAHHSGSLTNVQYKVQEDIDGTISDLCDSRTLGVSADVHSTDSVIVTSSGNSGKFRIYSTGQVISGNDSAYLVEAQFYGRVDV